MLKAIAITYPFLSDYASQEIKEKINTKTKTLENAVIFDVKDKEQLAQLSYSLQSISHIGLLLLNSSFNKIEELKQKIKETKIKTLDKKTFCARCIENSTEHDTKELEAQIGSHIFQNIKDINPEVDLENPELNFLFQVNKNNIILFQDFSGLDLSKRDYKVFINRLDVKGSLAYLLLRFANYNKNQSILDPFCKAGTIAIEAALYLTNTSPNFFRKDRFIFQKYFENTPLKDQRKEINKKTIFAYDSLLKNITATRKNAKIADINKAIQFSRTILEDIDLKFEKTLDLICSFPPQENKFNTKKIVKTYNELFRQGHLTLKKTGKIALIMLNKEKIIKIADKNSFKIIKQQKTFAGQQPLHLLLFERNQKA
jgi:23S rRNA G2445 N2-methylase RlmL